ncbi:hypothetical protein HDU86_004546 [Geranomyces michiganensis]|nr:hypothetical protein HDU86_004546 [Geranomyces michiganensis]
MRRLTPADATCRRHLHTHRPARQFIYPSFPASKRPVPCPVAWVRRPRSLRSYGSFRQFTTESTAATVLAAVQHDEKKLHTVNSTSSIFDQADWPLVAASSASLEKWADPTYLRKLHSEILARDVNGALTTYRRIMSSPEGRSRITHRVLRSLVQLVRKGRWGPNPVRATVLLLDDMRRLGIPLDMRDYNLLVDCYIALQDDAGLHKVILEMKEKRHQPDVTTYNLMLANFADRGNLAAVRSGLERMLATGVRPDIVTYNTVLSALANRLEQNSATEMATVIRRMEADSIYPDAITYNVLIKAYMRAGDTEAGMTTLSSMIEAGFAADAVTYRTIIAGFLRNRDAAGAEVHYHAMVRAGYRPPVWLLERFLSVAAESRDREAAERWLQEIATRGRHVGETAKLSMIRLAAAERDLRQLENTLDLEIGQDPFASSDPGVFYRIAVIELLKRNALSLIPAACALLEAKGFPIDPMYERIWQTMLRRRSNPITVGDDGSITYPPTIEPPAPSAHTGVTAIKSSFHDKSFGSIVDANRQIATLAKLPETFPEAISLYHSLPGLGFAPTAESLSPILGGFARIPDMDSLCSRWTDMEAAGIALDVACHNARVAGWLRAGNATEAARAMDSLMSSVKPNSYTARLRLELAVAAGRYEEAVHLVEEVCRTRDGGAYNALNKVVDRLCRDGRLEGAHRCWLAVRTIVEDGRKSWNKARLLWYPSIAALIAGHLHVGNIDAAMQVYQVAIKDGFSFEEPLLLTMAHILHSEARSADLEWLLADAVEKRTISERTSWKSVVTLLKDFDGTMACRIIKGVITRTAVKPTARDAGVLIMASFAVMDGTAVDLLARLFISNSVALESRLLRNLFASRRMSWPPGAVKHLLDYAIQRAHHSGLPLEERTAAYALESLVAGDDALGAQLAFKYMTDQGMLVTRAQRGRLMDLLCRKGLADDAAEIPSAGTRDVGDGPDSGMLQSLAILHARQGRLEQLDAMLDKLPDAAAAHAKSILEAIRNGHPETGLHALQRMLEQNIPVHSYTYVSMIAELAHRGEVAIVTDVVCSLVAAGIVPDIFVHNLVIKAYVRAGRTREALALLAQPGLGLFGAAGLSLKPDAWAWNTIVAGLARERDWDSLALAKDMMHREGFNSDLATCTSLLHCARTVEDVQALEAEVETMGVVCDTKWFKTLGTVYARLKMPRHCEEAVKKCTEVGIWQWNLILNSWMSVGEYWTCVRIYDDMIRHGGGGGGMQPDLVTFNTLISAALHSPQLADVSTQVDRWLAEMARRGLTPSARTHTLLLSRAAAARDPDLAARHFDAIVLAQAQPTEQAFVSLFLASSEHGNLLQWAKEIVDTLMPSHRVRPTRLIHRAIVFALARAKQVEDVQSWIEKMAGSGFDPHDAILHHALVQAHIASDNLVAAEAAVARYAATRTRMHSLAPNPERQKISIPASVSADSMPEDLFPYHMLADAYCEAEKPPNVALRVLQRIEVTAADGVTLGIAMKVLLKAKCHSAATALWEWAVEGRRSTRDDADNELVTYWTASAPPMRRLVSEAFICSYIDSTGMAVHAGKKTTGTSTNRNATTWHKDPNAELHALWTRILSLGGNGINPRVERFASFPTENMCNSHIEALMRCGELGGGIKILSRMDGGWRNEDMALAARPTPKTIMTVVRPLLQGGQTNCFARLEHTPI